MKLHQIKNSKIYAVRYILSSPDFKIVFEYNGSVYKLVVTDKEAGYTMEETSLSKHGTFSLFREFILRI